MGEPNSILSVLRLQLARLDQKWTGAQRCSFLEPHCPDSLECKRVLRIQLHHFEIAQLGFVVVAGFKIIVGLGKKAAPPGFFGAGSDERDIYHKGYNFE